MRTAPATLFLTLLAFSTLVSGPGKAQTNTKAKSSPQRKAKVPISKSAPDVRYEAAQDALQELDSASSVGLDYRQFKERVINVKIKVDKLGDSPRYELMKKTTEMLIDVSALWNGYVTGSLSEASIQGLRERYADDPDVTRGLSKISGGDLQGVGRQMNEIYLEYGYKVLWTSAQLAMSEVLGKSPTGTYAKMKAEQRIAASKPTPVPTPVPAPTSTPAPAATPAPVRLICTDKCRDFRQSLIDLETALHISPPSEYGVLLIYQRNFQSAVAKKDSEQKLAFGTTISAALQDEKFNSVEITLNNFTHFLGAALLDAKSHSAKSAESLKAMYYAQAGAISSLHSFLKCETEEKIEESRPSPESTPVPTRPPPS